MKAQADYTLSRSFWRACAALVCVLLTTSLMNVAVFPRFDAVFTYARDVSVLANAVTLMTIGLIATFRPTLLRARLLTGVSLGLLGVGAVLLPVGLIVANAPVLTMAACALSIGRGWTIVMVGVAASRLEVRHAGVCIALAFVMEYVVTTLIWVIPAMVSTVLFVVLPFVTIALIWQDARPLLEVTEHGEAPADFSVTQPSTFLPLVSQLFVCLFLFRVAFGYSLRFGEIGGVPLSDFLGIVPVAAVALYVVLSRRPFPVDVLSQISVLLVVAGFLVVSMDYPWAQAGSVTLLSAGNTLFDMVAWLALIAVAGRNAHGAVAVFAWGRGVASLGSTAGAALGVWSNTLFGGGLPAAELVTGALILVFVGYALIGLRKFSFAATIEGVEPVVEAVAKSPEQEFEERCREVADRFGLSPRELEVFMMLARGRDRAYIQERLVVSRNTVKAHVKHVYAKLDIHTHQELIDLVEEG